jgi:hypothetical protein
VKYERQLVDFRSLQDGDIFEHPVRDDTICKVTYANLKREEEQEIKIVQYTIVEGSLHWPVIYLPPEFEVTLLLPTTTYVALSGKAWIDKIKEDAR